MHNPTHAQPRWDVLPRRLRNTSCLFLKIRKRKSLPSLKCSNHISMLSRYFLTCTKIPPRLIPRKAGTEEKQSEVQGEDVKRNDICGKGGAGRKTGSGVFSVCSEETWERQSWKGRRRQNVRDIETTEQRKRKTVCETWRSRKLCFAEQGVSSPAPSPPEQPSWVANYDELLAPVGVSTSPVSI